MSTPSLPAFTWDTLHAALAGAYPVGPIRDMPLRLPYGGRNGQRHFHAGCPPLDAHRTPVADPAVTVTTLGLLPRDVVPSFRHRCADDFAAWLPHEVQIELTLLAVADRLTRPWHDAVASSRRHGRPILPRDNQALTDGRLDLLLRMWQDHLRAYPDRVPPATQLSLVTADRDAWADLLARRAEVEAADPHREVLAFQAAAGLPTLHGTPAQVRYAERIRFDAWHSDAAGVHRIAQRETDAGVWIGLHLSGELDETGWDDMRDRMISRAQTTRY